MKIIINNFYNFFSIDCLKILLAIYLIHFFSFSEIYGNLTRVQYGGEKEWFSSHPRGYTRRNSGKVRTHNAGWTVQLGKVLQNRTHLLGYCFWGSESFYLPNNFIF